MQEYTRPTAFYLSMMAWLPVVLWWTPGTEPSTHRVWLPCAIVFAVLQSCAALEAVYRFGERYRLVVRLVGAVAPFSLAAAVGCWLLMPVRGDVITQVTAFVTYQRAAALVFLVLACGLLATFLKAREWWRPEGRHLLLMTLLVATWAIPAMIPRDVAGRDWGWWRDTTRIAVWCRGVLMVVWLASTMMPICFRWRTLVARSLRAPERLRVDPDPVGVRFASRPRGSA